MGITCVVEPVRAAIVLADLAVSSQYPIKPNGQMKKTLSNKTSHIASNTFKHCYNQIGTVPY